MFSILDNYFSVGLEPLKCAMIVMPAASFMLEIVALHIGLDLNFFSTLTSILVFFGRDPIIIGVANLLQILTALVALGGYVYIQLRKTYAKKANQNRKISDDKENTEQGQLLCERGRQIC